MYSVFFLGKNIKFAWIGVILICLSLLVQAHISVEVTYWHRDFYNILANATPDNLDQIYSLIFYYFKIIIIQIFCIVVTDFFGRIWCLKWREAVSLHYTEMWNATQTTVEGASQRIQEDIKIFVDTMEDLGLKFVKAVVLLVSLLPVLYQMSGELDLPFVQSIPGGLILIIITIYFLLLSLSWIIGRKLPALHYNNQVVEAQLRKELVLSEDDKLNFGSLSSVLSIFNRVKSNYKVMFLHYCYFDLWYMSQNQFMIMLPYLLFAPSLCKGMITLGVLSQAREIFRKVYAQFSIVLENWKKISELRSVYIRMRDFEHAMNSNNDVKLYGVNYN